MVVGKKYGRFYSVVGKNPRLFKLDFQRVFQRVFQRAFMSVSMAVLMALEADAARVERCGMAFRSFFGLVFLTSQYTTSFMP